MQNTTIPHPPAPTHRRRPKEGWRSIASTVALILAAPLIAWTLTVFFFQSYEVEGSSMETTLQDNDRLIVWKLGKSWSSLWNNDFIPERGNVVIFHRPKSAGPATEGDKHLIKRVVALPGERVAIFGGTVTVFNKDHPDGFQPDQAVGYKLSDSNTTGDIDITVPDGQVYVLGDNRGNSYDSRNFGPVATDQIIGSLALRIYPFTKFDLF